jgi:serine O-acetyltransferase
MDCLPPSEKRPVHTQHAQHTQPARRARYWEPSRRLLQTLSDYKRDKLSGTALGLLKSKVAVVRHRFWSVVTGADIPLNTWGLGEDLSLEHPNGVVIHPEVEMGPHCQLLHQVTLGTGPLPGVPRLGSHVFIGAGAKILGGVTIGDHAVIGANAVVIHDVPPGATAVGVPAQIKTGARSVRGSSSQLDTLLVKKSGT